ncbi:MAG: hypothetical protein LUI13_01735, partial [Lachnospiraceae bacterium]|nr:hypothetical protein [Lachnospiraceae bacterium]
TGSERIKLVRKSRELSYKNSGLPVCSFGLISGKRKNKMNKLVVTFLILRYTGRKFKKRM